MESMAKCRTTFPLISTIIYMALLYPTQGNSCGAPPTIANAVRFGSDFTYQATITYTCNSGYQVAIGSTSRTCGSNGEWSGSDLICAKDSCGAPPTIANAARSGSVFTYEATVTYTCNSGYQAASGSTSKTCGSNMAWSGIDLVCAKVSCGAPPTIANAARSGSVFTYQATVTYTCNSGHQVASGSTSRTCGSNKAWSGSDLVCGPGTSAVSRIWIWSPKYLLVIVLAAILV